MNTAPILDSISPGFAVLSAGTVTPYCRLTDSIDLTDSRSEEHTSELQSRRDLHSFPTRRSSDLHGTHPRLDQPGVRGAIRRNRHPILPFDGLDRFDRLFDQPFAFAETVRQGIQIHLEW